MRHCNRRIGIAGNSKIFFQSAVTDARILSGTFPHDRLKTHRLFLRASVCQAEFPVFVTLRLHRTNHLPQECLIGTIERHHDADAGCSLPRSRLLPLTAQRLLRRLVMLIPWLIRHIFRFHLLLQPDEKLLHSVMLQITHPFDNLLHCNLHMLNASSDGCKAIHRNNLSFPLLTFPCTYRNPFLQEPSAAHCTCSTPHPCVWTLRASSRRTDIYIPSS